MRTSLARLVALVAVVGCFVAIPASASAVATLSGQVYYSPPLGFNVPLEGVDVAIKTQFDAPVKSLKTAADGTWSTTVYGGAGFDYKVYVSNKYGHVWPASGEINAHAVDGVVTGNLDFEVRGSAIYGLVFHDLNSNGTQDPGEAPIGDADVSITAPGITKTVKTFQDGTYATWPPLLPSGPYSVEASKAGYTAVLNPQPVNPAAGADAYAPDFGLHWPTGTVTGNVYAETNGMPGHQPGEPPIAGADLTVSGSYDGQAFSLPAQSQADGSFSLPVFNGSDRTIAATQPAAYADGPDFTQVAGAVTGADEFTSVTVPANGSTGAFDFGETGGTISGLAFSDRDADAAFDAGEPGVAGRKIHVTGPGYSETATSAGDGSYELRGVPAGDITLTPDVTNDALAPAARVLHPGIAETLTGKDFGYRFASLAGTVVDRQNGQPIKGVTVALGGLTTTSGDDGSWSFHELAPATYALAATPPAGFDPAASSAGNLGGAGALGAITGIGTGIGQIGTGYELGLSPSPAAPAAPADPTAAATGPAARLATKVKIIARKRTAVRKSRLSLGCQLDAGRLQACSFVIKNKRGKVLARGKARAVKGGTRLTVKLELTRLGKRTLKKGLAGKATVKATQAGGPALSSAKKVALRKAGR